MKKHNTEEAKFGNDRLDSAEGERVLGLPQNDSRLKHSESISSY